MANPEKSRQSIRLENYDYSQAGAYFVTICTHNRKCLFGQISGGRTLLNRFGKLVGDEWDRTPQVRDDVMLDRYVIMPNHIHGIIIVSHEEGVWQYAPTDGFRSPSKTVGAVIRGFKSAITKQINESRKTPGAPVWQRNYWDRVIRNERELSKAREYIQNNPLKWELDRENPANINV